MSKKLKGFSPARKFAWDKGAEEQGVWRTVFDGAAELKIARFNNPKHNALLRRLRDENEELLKDETTEKAQSKLLEISGLAMAETVLTDWRGILDEDGNELPYSNEAAYDLLKNYEEFADLVFNLSLETEQYRRFKEGEAVKN